jgi:hypothetical protein
LSDQYGNNVDEEIRVPIKDFHGKETWTPLGIHSWIETYGTKDGSQKPPTPVPLKTWSEWAIAYADGSIGDVHYKVEGEALKKLQIMRRELKSYGVPEEYWPALMERTVETVATSWKILSV